MRNMPRDRRAFSFPATQAEPCTHVGSFTQPMPILRRRDSKPSQVTQLPFSRKPMGVSLTASPATPPIKEGPNGTLRAPNAGQTRRQSSWLGVSKSTGGQNTPLDPESVFCSTSESEGEDIPPLKFMPTAPPTVTSTVPSFVPLCRKSTKSTKSTKSAMLASSPTSPAITRTDFYHRNQSQSPVAALVASSASSRSREDIISWAKAVGLRPKDKDDQEAEEERGRSRTRRTEVLPSFTPMSEHDIIAEEREHHAGTTPKGLGSTLAGLGIGGFGVGPIVKALTSSMSPSSQPVVDKPNSSPGLQSVPAPAEVSPIAVVTSAGGAPIPSSNLHDAEAPPFYFGGGTPTLSTVSCSEAVDPSNNGTTDQAEFATDDNYSTVSYARRSSLPNKVFKPPTLKQTPTPLRPITTTATAIWSFSSYLRSLAPFSLASVIAPYAPIAAHENSKNPSGITTPAPIPEDPAEEDEYRSSPLTASRQEDNASEIEPEPLVMSFPMDIVVPLREYSYSPEERRGRDRSACNMGERSRSRMPRSRSRGRQRSRAPRSRSRSRSIDSGRERQLVRRSSYDADTSDDDENLDSRRGRSRRGKVLARDMPERRNSEVAPQMPQAVRRLSEGAMRALGDRSESRGRAPRR